ncbi:hypothetical protein ACJX0J_024658, partial [Zea mays]
LIIILMLPFYQLLCAYDGHYVLTFFELTFFDISGALWDEDTFVISLEEGHYAAYIKGTPSDSIDTKPMYMTDEDVFYGLSDVTDLMLSLLFGFGSCCLVFVSAISDSLVITFVCCANLVTVYCLLHVCLIYLLIWLKICSMLIRLSDV